MLDDATLTRLVQRNPALAVTLLRALQAIAGFDRRRFPTFTANQEKDALKVIARTALATMKSE